MSQTSLETLSRASLVGQPALPVPVLVGSRLAADRLSGQTKSKNSLGSPSVERSNPWVLDSASTPATERRSFDATPLSTVSLPDAQTTREEKRMYRIVLATIFFCFFLLGLNDGSIGPLLPVYQSYYHINFLRVSMVFISNCLGCLTSAVLNVFLAPRWAFSRILMLATVFQIIAYSIMTSAPKVFAVMCIGFFVNGMGMSLLNSQGNAILSMLNSPTAMGFAHAFYGSGALVAPLISTQFAGLHRWSLYYTILLGTSTLDLICFTLVFKGKGTDEVLSQMGVRTHEENEPLKLQRVSPRTGETTEMDDSRDGEVAETTPQHDGGSFGMVLKQIHVHILAAFVFIYVGTEVTIGGWIVTFMINERGGGPSSGYISSGFFGGLALGRILLLRVNRLLGERLAIFVYIAVGIVLEITIWFVPSLIGNAIAVSLVGMLLGPFYPIVMSQTGRIIPRKVLSGSIGWIAGFGQSGSAVLPFLTGALANRYGIIALQPLIVAMMASMAALWFMVPSIVKKRD